MPSDRSTSPETLTSPSALVWCLLALAAVGFILGIAGAMTALYLSSRAELPDQPAVLAAVLCFIVGCWVAAGLCALAWLCHAKYRQVQLAQRLASAHRPVMTGAAPPVEPRGLAQDELLGALSSAGGDESVLAAPASGADADLAPEGAVRAVGATPPRSVADLLDELRELNINVLLSDAQREAKRQYLTQREVEWLGARVERAAKVGDMIEAEQCLDRLARVAPGHVEIGRLRERVAQARAEVQARDLADAKRRAEDLMAAGEYADAEAVANGLLARHPAVPEAIALLERVRREAEAFANERRAQMYRRVEDEAAARRWRSAVAIAEDLLEAYPDTPEADAVRAQFETLRENARIEEVRQRRDQIGDMIARRRFAEAIRLAQDLIARFPDTAAASELRQQMTRLKELAASGQDGGA